MAQYGGYLWIYWIRNRDSPQEIVP